jgi:two-component system sensor histidine kinase/response regulator
VIETPVLKSDKIMAVDDHPANLKLLEDMLRQRGYQVHSFPRGRLALAAAAKDPPDLILLDVNMPEMNGYEVCERLRADARLSRIPVIFLSALNEPPDKVKAFESGGVDYVSKPFQFDEVLARVETHLELHRLQQGLEQQNSRLEEIVTSRTRELAEAHARLTILDRAKSEFLSLISHELRTPLNGLIGIGELVLCELESGPETTELRDLFEQSRRRLLSIIDDALLLTQIEVEGESFALSPVSVCVALTRAIDETSELARCRQVTIDPPPADLGLVLGVEDLLVRAFRGLLETAVKFSTAGGAVGLGIQAAPDAVRIVIDSQGLVVPVPLLATFFELFSISEASTPGGDLGLGAAAASRILSLFGGSISVENREPPGIRLTAEIKTAQPRAAWTRAESELAHSSG